MAVSFLSPARTVLLVTDEALYVYKADGAGVKLLDQIPWQEEDFVPKLSKLIARQGGGKPVIILNDVVEQHYRKERIARNAVSILDRNSFVQRKLMAAFPGYPIKAAYPLKEKAAAIGGQGKKAGASDIFLFAAVPGSEGFGATVQAVRKSLAPVTGFFLLPVESAGMVKTLAMKLNKADKTKGKKQTEWSVFIGQHRNGGLRQIVTKNGEIALTRMTPISLNDENSGLWAAELRQEFAATMSYLSRFGYDSNDKLNVIILGNAHTHQSLRGAIEVPCQLSILTVSETARILRLSVGRQDDERFADTLHVAWAARKSNFVLPMKARELEQVARPRQSAVAVSFMLLLSACFMTYQGVGHFQAIAKSEEQVDTLARARANLQAEYDIEAAKKKALGYDVTLVQNSLAIYKALQRQEIGSIDLFRNIGKALASDLRLESVEVKRIREPLEERAIQQDQRRNISAPEPEPLYEARLKMLFPSTADIDAGNQEVRSFKERLQGLMPGEEVKVVKFLKDYEFTEQVVVETGNFDARDLAQDYVSEVMVRGRFE